MRILVLSDSHSSLSVMRRFVDVVKPDNILHLGDYYDDGTVIAQEYPHIPFLQVPGNCDAYRVSPDLPQTLTPVIDGVKILMTHGHGYHVKSGTFSLIRAAQTMGVQVAAYGHTHIPECSREGELWVLNPGSCGYGGGTAGLIITENRRVKECRILSARDMEGSV